MERVLEERRMAHDGITERQPADGDAEVDDQTWLRASSSASEFVTSGVIEERERVNRIGREASR